MTQTAVKYFTLTEANATLPYVRRIVEDMVGEYERWRACIFRYEVLSAEAKAEEGESEEQLALRAEVDRIANRINGCIDELSQVGCVFKGIGLDNHVRVAQALQSQHDRRAVPDGDADVSTPAPEDSPA